MLYTQAGGRRALFWPPVGPSIVDLNGKTGIEGTTLFISPSNLVVYSIYVPLLELGLFSLSSSGVITKKYIVAFRPYLHYA